MTETTLVSITAATQVYKNPIAVRFFENLDAAVDEFNKNGKLCFSTLSNIVGPAPCIPMSPDTDAMLEAYDESARYADKILNIENKIRTCAAKNRS